MESKERGPSGRLVSKGLSREVTFTLRCER